MTTEERLQQIRRRHASATPDDWHVGEAADGLHRPECRGCHNVWAGEGVDVTTPCAGLSAEDAAFMAHARRDVPFLPGLVARLGDELAKQYQKGKL